MTYTTPGCRLRGSRVRHQNAERKNLSWCMGNPIGCDRGHTSWYPTMLRMMIVQGQGNLLHVVGALNTLPRLASQLYCRQQEAINIVMIATTTSNSISVKPKHERGLIFRFSSVYVAKRTRMKRPRSRTIWSANLNSADTSPQFQIVRAVVENVSASLYLIRS